MNRLAGHMNVCIILLIEVTCKFTVCSTGLVLA